LQGQDALLAIVQMPPGIPVATVAIDGAQNAAVLATQILALTDSDIANRLDAWRGTLSQKIVKANAELAKIDSYKFKTN
jgi:5-(carboxyamino)imidazole ribonucleotide mutase